MPQIDFLSGICYNSDRYLDYSVHGGDIYELNEDEGLSYAVENYPIIGVMADFAPGDYQYIGRTKLDLGEHVTKRFEFDDFYLRNDGKFMLHIYELPEQDILEYPMLAELPEGGGTAVCAEVLTPSEA